MTSARTGYPERKSQFMTNIGYCVNLLYVPLYVVYCVCVRICVFFTGSYVLFLFITIRRVVIEKKKNYSKC